MSSSPDGARPPRVPPRWFVRTAWRVHRAIYRVSRGRLGLRRPSRGKFGMLRLHTVGRRTGAERTAILGYFEVGEDLVTLAMNGWSDPQPAWWLNLLARPEARVDLAGGLRRDVRAREAVGEERERLWSVVKDASGYGDLDGYAALRDRETAVVVLEPRY